jgi:predicted GNAT family acetyltransferase
MQRMRVERVENASMFLEVTLPLRLADPVNTNVLGSIATSVADESRTYADACWWVVRDGDEVVGAAVHTPPYRPVLSPMREDAARLLADAAHSTRSGVRGVTGPEPAATAFANRICELTGWNAARGTLRELIYVLGEHTPRPDVSGCARLAHVDDVPLLLEWFDAFSLEALGSIHTVTADDMHRRLQHRDMIIWEDQGIPVAMAGHAALTPSPAGRLGRIGPVFTVAGRRGHGYGAAVTSAMVEHLRALDCAVILLYTDADYAQSNKVYRALGFEEVGSVVELGDVTA